MRKEQALTTFVNDLSIMHFTKNAEYGEESLRTFEERQSSEELRGQEATVLSCDIGSQFAALIVVIKCFFASQNSPYVSSINTL